MAQILVDDVLREIFLHVANPNPFTGAYTIEGLHNLYPCILVNKTWCSIAMPILWSQPFHFLKDKHEAGAAVINMYLRFLDDKELEYLFNQGIDVSLMLNFSVHQSGRFQQFYSDDSDSDYESEHPTDSMEVCEYRRPPMFNYPGFLRSLWYESMVQAVESWCSELSELMNPTPPEDEDEDLIGNGERDMSITSSSPMDEQEDALVENAEFLLMRSILRTCLKRGSRLYGLFLNPDRLDKLNDEMYEMLLIDEEFKDLVSPVKSLEINGMIRKDKVYVMLGQRCRKLECLHIHNLWARSHDERHIDNFAEAIGTLISSQYSLLYFTLSNCKAYTRAIILPLKYQSSSLRYVRFEQIDFRGCDPWESVAECKRIEFLEVYECINLEEEMVAPVAKAKFGKGFEARYVSSHQCQGFREWVDKISGGVRNDDGVPVGGLNGGTSAFVERIGISNGGFGVGRNGVWNIPSL
ncbi:12640_t:CDS:2 [Acaulospora morrowiae]|uniref:12640_t:CDS:1 n=1 Tax=Acaulospora morrowiae TaxID=94023 RepID=A0A9N8VP04_9GLOM|nr:12640_t:CDS:2 [Acaulospora morrowiae]